VTTKTEIIFRRMMEASEPGRHVPNPFIATGVDAYGNPIHEEIAVTPQPKTIRAAARRWITRLTPWWAWNALIHRTGISKSRFVRKIDVAK